MRTDTTPIRLRDQVQIDEKNWTELKAPIYRHFLAAVVALDATDRTAGHRLLDGLTLLAERQHQAAKRAPMGQPWMGAERELGHVVEVAVQDLASRAAFTGHMAGRGHPLHMAEEVQA